MDILFILNSILLGVGLAMDAFSVSVANGLNEPDMSRGKMSVVAGTYAGYQFAMPMIGWLCVHTIADEFETFQQFIPWIALALLLWIGVGMLRDGLAAKREKKEEAFVQDVENIAEKTVETISGTLMSAEKKHEGTGHDGQKRLSAGTLLIQGLATSIDALSVGFTIAEYGLSMALVCSLLIALVTYFLCMIGLLSGKKFGEKVEGKASILGGIILIGIGLEIFITGIF